MCLEAALPSGPDGVLNDLDQQVPQTRFDTEAANAAEAHMTDCTIIKCVEIKGVRYVVVKRTNRPLYSLLPFCGDIEDQLRAALSLNSEPGAARQGRGVVSVRSCFVLVVHSAMALGISS